jgi:hypothetical protein
MAVGESMTNSRSQIEWITCILGAEAVDVTLITQLEMLTENSEKVIASVEQAELPQRLVAFVRGEKRIAIAEVDSDTAEKVLEGRVR